MKHHIYLAGPMTGFPLKKQHEWRKLVADYLNNDYVQCLSPLRGERSVLIGKYVTSGAGIMGRDSNDVHRSTALFVNLFGAERVSIGTVMEMAWAWKAGIPVVCVAEPGNVHRHEMLDRTATYIVPTLEEGMILMQTLIVDGYPLKVKEIEQ